MGPNSVMPDTMADQPALPPPLKGSSTASLSRSARAATMPSEPPRSTAASPPTKGHKHNRSYAPSSPDHHRRHHKSHHSHSNHHYGFSRAATESQSAAAPSATSPLSDLLSPVKTVGQSITAIARSAEKGIMAWEKKDEGTAVSEPTRQGEREREERHSPTAAESRQPGTKTAEEMRLEKEALEAMEQATTANYDKLTSQVLGLHSSLTTTHASLLSSMPEISARLSQLRALSVSSSALLHSFTRASAPSLSSEFEARVAAASAHIDAVEKDRIRALQDRLDAARRRMEELDRRMEKVRDTLKVAEREDAEGGWLRRKRTVFGVVWAIALVLLVLVVLVTKLDDTDGSKGRRRANIGVGTKGRDNWAERVILQDDGRMSDTVKGELREMGGRMEADVRERREEKIVNISVPEDTAADPLDRIFAGF